MTQDFDGLNDLVEPATTFRLGDLLKRPMTERDVVAIRACFPAGLRSLEEAEALFTVERSDADRGRAWSDLFVQLLTDFIVWGERPTGAVEPVRATWLLEQVDRQLTPTGVALLVNLLDEAHIVPHGFAQATRERALRVFHPTGIKTGARIAA